MYATFVVQIAVQIDVEDDNDVIQSDRTVSVGRSRKAEPNFEMTECPRQAKIQYNLPMT
jgi:hypothetical protein